MVGQIRSLQYNSITPSWIAPHASTKSHPFRQPICSFTFEVAPEGNVSAAPVESRQALYTTVSSVYSSRKLYSKSSPANTDCRHYESIYQRPYRGYGNHLTYPRYITRVLYIEPTSLVTLVTRLAGPAIGRLTYPTCKRNQTHYYKLYSV